MNCKNCNEVLEDNAHFCDNCGAKVIKNRITLRFLLAELFASMGFESLYFTTLKKMVTTPHEVIKEYLDGVRKRYVNPFAFIAVGAALSLIVFNYFSDDYFRLQSVINQSQIEELKKTADVDLSKINDLSDKELQKLKQDKISAQHQLEFMDTWGKYLLKYFNIVAFLFLPFYSLLSKFTYFKPHNYGEHIVINAYIQGATMYISVLAFFLSMVVHPNLFMSSMLLVVLYYLYAFGKLYNLNYGKSLLKLLKFIAGLLLLCLAVLIVSFVVGIVIAMLNPELFKTN